MEYILCQGGSGGSKGSESGGSESGASAVDSMTGEHNVSGRSSAYGDNGPDSIPPIGGITVNQAPRSETNSVGVPTAFTVSASVIAAFHCSPMISFFVHSFVHFLLTFLFYHFSIDILISLCISRIASRISPLRIPCVLHFKESTNKMTRAHSPFFLLSSRPIV